MPTNAIRLIKITAQNKAILPENQESYFTHILCESGRAQFCIENKNYLLRKNDIAIWLPNHAVSEIRLSADFEASCLMVSFDLMSQNNPDIRWGIKAYLFTKEHPIVSLSEKENAICLENFALVEQRYRNKSNPFQHQLVGLQLQLFILEMWSIFSKEMEKRTISTQQGTLFEQFLHEAQQHCMEEREVRFYADKLAISAKYLTEICKKNSGKTASDWIQNYITQRIIALLEDKSLAISEIAHMLHFSSLTFFSRYVRKVLGVSPSAYRER
ncbi:helix-turn-helix domain-containing protein [Aquirufa regiilacus]